MTSRPYEGQGFCDDSTKALVLKTVTMGEEVSKIVRNCMTSFMHDPDYKSRGFFQLHFGSRALVRGGGDEVEDVHGAQR